MSRPLLYVAYPMRLDLGAANAIQTYATVKELKRILPRMRLVVPRWLREKSAFDDLDALHLPRPAVNKLSRFLPWAGWSYLERTIYSAMLAALMTLWRVTGRGYRVAYVRDTVCAAWLTLLRPLHGARVVYEVHDLEADHPTHAPRWPARLWKRVLPWLDDTALRRSARLVSLTREFSKWAERAGIRSAREIAIIPDAYDPTLYHRSDAIAARRESGLSESAFIVGYAGLTFAYRRLDLLVDAFAKLRDGGVDAQLLLVGGRPSEVDALRKQAEHLRIPPERLLTPGQVEQRIAARHAAAADVLVIPDTVTSMTASPLKLFEYMALGKPVVCKDMPALREVISERAAIFFPEGDTDALAGALASLAANAELRERMGEAAQQEASGYTYAARARKIAEVVQGCK